MQTIRLLLVEDQHIVRQGLKRLLELEDYLSVVAEAESTSEAAAAARSVRPDVILMDLKLGSESGLEATRRILAENPEARILALTAYDDFPMVEEAIAAGVLGYAPKQITLEELCHAIREVNEGRRYIHHSLMSILLDGIRQNAVSRPSVRPVLTEEERALLRHLSDGRGVAEIAAISFVSERTTRRRIQALLAKVGVASTAQAVASAVRQGWL